ncbi:MAG: hypothetical protein U9R66_05150 [Thermodesulfobacteriota bacterium]|nr:hypothetical protein [Thermodesulfobacteriota bacterium]
MFGRFRKKNRYGLIGDDHTTYLTTVRHSVGQPPSLEILAITASGLEDEVTLPRLLAAAPGIKGEVSLVPPLERFKNLSLNIPKIPDETVGKTLPYHLAKNLDQPLSDYIYDWQIVQHQKDSLLIGVYLYPQETFEKIKEELGRNHLELKYLEPAIFPAFAYLEQEHLLPETDTLMSALIWYDSVTFGVYENGMISLTRTLNIKQPESAFQTTLTDSDFSINNQKKNTGENKKNGSGIILENEENSILSDFNLLQPENDEKNLMLETSDEKTHAASAPFPPLETAMDEGEWDNYIQQITLEVMRTRDYYTSVLKGNPVKTIRIAGAEIIWDKFSEVVQNSLDIRVEPLCNPAQILKCPPLLHVIGMGARTK